MNVYIKKQQLFWRKSMIFLVIIALLIIVLNMGQAFVRNSFYAVANPFSASLSHAGSATFATANSFFNFNALGQENSNLKQENQNLLSQIAALQSQIQQQSAVQNIVEQTKPHQFSLAMANVIGVDSIQQTITIDQGTDDGIVEHMPVVTSQKAVVGRITKTYNHTATILLASALKSVIDVKIQQPDPQSTPIYGVVRGTGALGVYLDLVNSDHAIVQGDVLVTSGLEGTFPRDILVGKITTVDKNDVKAFQTAQVQSFFDIKSTDTVFVITSYKK